MLILAATPIGNLGDATRRLVEALERVRVVTAEDTRVAHRLMIGLGVANRPRILIVNEHTEQGRIEQVLALAAEEDVLVLTDAGMPTVSDPGFRLVRAAVGAGVAVSALPGPSAVPTALAVSGLPTDRFVFEGFAPRKAGDRSAWLGALAAEPRTLVVFESPNRLAGLLADMAAAFGGDRRAAVCRELTKLHEEVVRGTLDDLAAWAADGVRGEICLVVAGAEPVVVPLEDAVRDVERRIADGAGAREASEAVAEATGLPRRALYEAALKARRAGTQG